MRTLPMRRATKNTGSAKHCAACGRELKGEAAWVEVVNGGQDVAEPGSADESDAGYMGFFPVGPDCARKYFRGFTQ